MEGFCSIMCRTVSVRLLFQTLENSAVTGDYTGLLIYIRCELHTNAVLRLIGKCKRYNLKEDAGSLAIRRVYPSVKGASNVTWRLRFNDTEYTGMSGILHQNITLSNVIEVKKKHNCPETETIAP